MGYLDDFFEDEIALRECVIRCGDQLRVTSLGHRRYGARFAACGIRIERITTEAALRAALAASEPIVMQQIAREIESQPASIERNIALAIARGNWPEVVQLQNLMNAARSRSMSVVQPLPMPD